MAFLDGFKMFLSTKENRNDLVVEVDTLFMNNIFMKKMLEMKEKVKSKTMKKFLFHITNFGRPFLHAFVCTVHSYNMDRDTNAYNIIVGDVDNISVERNMFGTQKKLIDFSEMINSLLFLDGDMAKLESSYKETKIDFDVSDWWHAGGNTTFTVEFKAEDIHYRSIRLSITFYYPETQEG